MKVRIFLFALLFSFSFFSVGQNFKIGIKGSLGGAFFKNSNNQAFTSSYSVGGFGNYRLTKATSFQAELLFSKKGSAYKVLYTDNYGVPAGETKLIYNFYYFGLPLMLKLSTKGELNRLYFMTGISPAIFLTGNTKLQGFGKSNITNINAFDIGWINSIGVEFNIGKKLSFVELRFNNGLKAIIKDQPYKNFTYGLASGIRF